MAAPSVFRPGATALISGSASGVGFAFARICRKAGMNLALLDRDANHLSAAVAALKSDPTSSTHPGVKTESYTLDVGDLPAWQSTAKEVQQTFGDTINLLMLNAGAAPTAANEQKWLDPTYFHATWNTNMFGVINGISAFLPMIQKSSGPSAIVITGSKQGITNPPGNPAYNASKSAVKTLAEHLAHDLRTSGNPSYAPQTSVHLLIPGWTYTGLSGNAGPDNEEARAKKPDGAWFPEQCAEYGVRGMKDGKFYLICPDNDVDEALDQARMTWQMGDVVESRSPLSRWDDKFKDDASMWIQGEAEKRRKMMLQREV